MRVGVDGYTAPDGGRVFSVERRLGGVVASGVVQMASGWAHGVLGVDLTGPGHYFHWGFVQLSLANLVVIALMLLVFVLALVLPFPGTRRRR